MKIISRIPTSKVLVSITEDELANILGQYSNIDITREFYDNAIKNEVDIQISDVYKKNFLINSIKKQSDYATARNQLQAMLDAITPIKDKVSDLAI